jgi:translation elongation factor EF-1alpha
VKDEKKPFAVPGESVIFVVTSQDFDFNTLRSGGIMCPKAYPTPVCTKFIAEIEVYDFERPLIRGERLVLHIGMAKISAVLTRINHIVNKETGEPLKKNPK